MRKSPMMIPSGLGFAKIINRIAPMYKGILRIFLSMDESSLINGLEIVTTLFVKSLLTSLCQREEFPSLVIFFLPLDRQRRARGNFFNQCQFSFDILNN